MGQEVEKPNFDLSQMRICEKCNDVVCAEKTGMAGRFMHFIEENITLHDPEPIDKCFRREVFKWRKNE